MSRFGVYFVPEPGSELAEFGALWLGWDIERGAKVPQPGLSGLPVRLSDITAKPRPYGFHATLKPPFRLAENRSPEALSASLEEIATETPPAELGRLGVATLSGFLALVAVGNEQIARLAEACVAGLDRFRAPPDAAELARRRAGGLRPRQERMLARWGYPYVFEEFRFHLTLTGPLDSALRAPVERLLAERMEPMIARPLTIREICLVGQGPDGFFRVLRRYPLLGVAREGAA